MKKLLLSGLVIVIFLAYSYHQRHQGAGPVAIARQPAASSGTVPPVQNTQSTPAPSTAAGQYKDGTYTGSVADAFYGNVQVQAVVRSGKLVQVQFLQHPNDNPTSRSINDQAMPLLQEEAVQAQTARVDTVTGATDTSIAFVQSLTAALSHAA